MCHAALPQGHAHPERFVKKHPTVQSLPDAVWINRPQPLLETGAEPPLGV